MPNKNKKSKQIPTNPWQVVWYIFWPPNTWKKKFALGSVIFIIVCFTLWVSAIPDTIKTEIIHFVKEQITNLPEQPQKSAVTGNSQASQPEVSKTPEIKRTAPLKQTQEQTKNTNTTTINQHTEGDQSPAIISNDVNIKYDTPRDKKTKE